MFENEIRKVVHQQVEYEWKTILCPKCKNFGHDIRECRKQLKENEKQHKGEQVINGEGQQRADKVEEIRNARQHSRIEIQRGKTQIIKTETTNSFNVLREIGQGSKEIREEIRAGNNVIGNEKRKEKDGEDPILNG